MLSTLFNFLIILLFFLIYLLFSEGGLNFNLLLFLVILSMQIIFVFSCLFLASLNIYIPDTEHFFKIFLQIWFWISPIVYPISIVPEYLKTVLSYNPFIYFLNYYHDIFVYKKISFILNSDLIYSLIFNLIFFFLSILFYKKIKNNIVDEI